MRPDVILCDFVMLCDLVGNYAIFHGIACLDGIKLSIVIRELVQCDVSIYVMFTD